MYITHTYSLFIIIVDMEINVREYWRGNQK